MSFCFFLSIRILTKQASGIALSESGETDDVIKGQGFLEYAADLDIVEDSDPGMLVISWKLNVNHEKCWEFSREEFIGGWSIHG